MKITLYYDYVCPYCYIATTRLQRLGGELGFEVEWRGIEIHPELPPQGVRRRETPRGRALEEYLRLVAETEGVEISLPGFVTNTRPALELSELAKDLGLFGELHGALYRAYFVEGVNIGMPNEVARVAVRAGLDAHAVGRAIKNRTMRERVEENVRAAERDMVLGVPTCVWEDGFALYGNQELDTLRKVLEDRRSRGT